MAIDNTITLLSFGMLVALSASVSSAQVSPAAINGAVPEASPTSAVTDPPTMAELPPKAPKVTCKGNQLTISAENSTLESILTAVHLCTGVQIDIPEGAKSSRTFEELGPGPARQVLESLLSGSDFNYVIESSDENPQKIESVLLMLGTSHAESAPTVASASDHSLTPGRRAWIQTRQNRASSFSAGESHAQDEAPAAPAAEEAVAAPVENIDAGAAQVPANDTPPPAAEAPVAPPANMAPSVPTANALAAAPSVASPSIDEGKSTEEKISDMQQMFQQRRLMTQQSQNSATNLQP
jgi:hypothetical protein